MTPDTQADDATQPPAEAEAAKPPEQQPAENQPDPSANSEAARWRVKLRDTEAQRDALSEKVTGYQRRDCERVVTDLLAQPADLWEIGHLEVSEFIGDDGEIDEDELREAANALIEQRPGLAKAELREPEPKNWGQHGGRPPASVGWESVIASR